MCVRQLMSIKLPSQIDVEKNTVKWDNLKLGEERLYRLKKIQNKKNKTS